MIIFLYGKDQYRLKRKINEIVEYYKEINGSSLSLKYFDLKEKSFQDFKDETQSISIFRGKKLMILENATTNEEFKEKFLKEIKRLSALEDILLFVDGDKTTEDKFFSTLRKYAKFQEFDLLSGEKLKTWIRKEFKKYKAEIEDAALEKLLGFTGNDLWRIGNEIEKLISYKRRRIIKSKDVENLVKPKIESDIFRTIDAIAQKNRMLALQLIHKHLEKGDTPFYLFSMINFQFRNLLTIKSQITQGNYFPRIGDLSKKLGLHPFVVEKTLRQTKKFSLEELKRIYRKIFKTDVYIKTGKIDPQVALDLFLAEI